MHPRAKPAAAKAKSQMRWEQGRAIYDDIAPSLQTPAQVAVLAYCWFRAAGNDCLFDESKEQIANATKLSQRSVRRILVELEAGGVIETVSQSRGRGNTARRKITGRAFRPPNKRGHG